ncbi:MAG: alpha/beta fold hydrolase [Candidatus Limnocylindrus sp.]
MDPLLLVHGSYITGAVDWGGIAPILAAEFEVIVPDCRGHGRSTDPRGCYSFKEMAADFAALIPALGFDRAHLIGHSNGGNVALVTLVEHPDRVASCVAQAANAFVSPDLIERIPMKLDPDRVRREEPEWMEEMIALHSEVHGPDYWATLLRRTAQEIVSEPNYLPSDLEAVQRPTLVIEGALDETNAIARHGRFIAEHVPQSELWEPEGIGHNVHVEIPAEWITRVRTFLGRSGARL